MKEKDIVSDFKKQAETLDGFILILNNQEEKKIFEKNFLKDFIYQFPLSAIAINYELANYEFLEKINNNGITLGIKLHPRLSNITRDKFTRVVNVIEQIDPEFIIIDCFYYGSSLETHINLDLSIYIAKYFKNNKILLAHSGGHKILEYMLYTRDLKNIYYDLSLTSNYLRYTSVRLDMINFIKFNYSKIFFGSDYPDFSIESAVDIYLDLTKEAKLNYDKINLIFEQNFVSFLNLEGKL
ncbi:hypothetical protein [Hydrogenimonas thermophila]|nr:hypothetical protein [Hydrogenimonas thermophila]